MAGFPEAGPQPKLDPTLSSLLSRISTYGLDLGKKSSLSLLNRVPLLLLYFLRFPKGLEFLSAQEKKKILPLLNKMIINTVQYIGISDCKTCKSIT
jgi:hypothetical protein